MAKAADGWTPFTVAASYDRATLLKLLWSSTDIVEALRTWEERQALSSSHHEQHSSGSRRKH